MDSSVVPLAPSHPPWVVSFQVFLSRHLAVSSLAVSHTGRHPEDWFSGIPSVQSAVQAAETTEVVASFADAHTSVSVLADFARRHHGSRGSHLLCRQVAPVCRPFLL